MRKGFPSRLILPTGWAFLAFCLSACGATPVPPTLSFYLPPSPAQVLPTSPSTASPTAATPGELSCHNDLKYLDDLTIPDGSIISPGSTLDKQWRVRNAGTCNWDERYRLRLVNGKALGLAPEQALFPARAGTEMVIRLVFTAPLEEGRYVSAWQAYDPDNEPFGDTIFIDILVSSSATE